VNKKSNLKCKKSNEPRINDNNVYKKTVLAVKNLVVKCQKRRSQIVHRIINNIENQQPPVMQKSKSVTCTYCYKIGHNIRHYKARIVNKK